MDLEQALLLGQVLQRVGAQVRDLETLGPGVEVLDHGLRHDHLAATRHAHDPRGPVHVVPDEAPVVGRDDADVDSGAGPDRATAGPGDGGQVPLCLHRRGDGIDDLGEHDEEAVTGRVDLVAVVIAPRPAAGLAVQAEHVLPLVAEPVGVQRRTLDVGEQHGQALL